LSRDVYIECFPLDAEYWNILRNVGSHKIYTAPHSHRRENLKSLNLYRVFASRMLVFRGVSYLECPTSVYFVGLPEMTHLLMFHERSVVILACFELGSHISEHISCRMTYVRMYDILNAIISGCFKPGIPLSWDALCLP
jgi:hypothetical protein